MEQFEKKVMRFIFSNRLFEKDVAYILDTKGMICLYDERKSLIGVIAKVVNR